MTTNTALLTSIARAVLHDNDGVAHLQRFLTAGLSRENVAHLRHIGVLDRPRIGWYVQPDIPSSAIEAIRVGGVLGCISAAASWGIVTPTGRQLTHVSLTRDTTRMRRSNNAGVRARAGTDRSVHWHWDRRIQPVAGWRVTPVDTLLQMASCVPHDWLVAAIDSARRWRETGPLIGAADLALIRDHLPARLTRAVDLSDGRAASSGETFLRLGIQRAGIPFALQVWLTNLYCTDILVDGWLPVESDGIAFHSSPEAVAHDRERDATLAYLGTPPLRFSQKQAIEERPFVVDTIARVWRAGPLR